MSSYWIRPLDVARPAELDVVTERCMATVLETIPEFGGSAEKAHAAFGNFTFSDMRAMFERSLMHPDQGLLVATDERDNMWGHAIFSVKTDPEKRKYGFCFSRYVHPEHRRRGIGSLLLRAQLAWWRAREAEYAYAQTHVTNVALQGLFREHGFVLSGPKRGNWDYYELRIDLRERARPVTP